MSRNGLKGLTIGGVTLSPTFATATTTYTGTATTAKAKVDAVLEDNFDTLEITLGDEAVTNGTKVTWASGENVLTFKVTDSISSNVTTYTVTVTAS